jgi:hypothetical protein
MRRGQLGLIMPNLRSELGRLHARLRLGRRKLSDALLCGTELSAPLRFGLEEGCFGRGLRFGRLMAQSGRLPPCLLELLRPSEAFLAHVAISRHQPPSAAISRHQPPSAAISRHQPSSAAISRHQPSSAAISRHQPQSAVISRHQPPSAAISRHQPSSGATHLRDTLEHLLHLRRLGRRLGGLGRLRLRRLGRGGDKGARLGAHATRFALKVLEALLMSTQSGIIIRGNQVQSGIIIIRDNQVQSELPPQSIT